MGNPLGPYISASGQPATGDQANAVVSGTITAVGPQAPFVFYGPFNVDLWASINTTLTTTAGSLTATVASGSGLTSGNAINSANVPKGTTAAVVSGTTITLAVPPIATTGDINPTDAKVRNLNFTTGLLGATVTDQNGYIPAGTTVLSVDIAAIAPNVNNPGQVGQITLSAKPTCPVPLNEFLTFARDGHAITVSGADTKATFTGTGIVPSGAVNLEKSKDGGSTWLLAQAYTTSTITTYYSEPERGVAYRLNCITYSANVNYRISTTGGAAMSVSTPAPI